MAERFKLSAAVYIVFMRDNKVLLELRQNTGFEDGKFGLVQGHVDPDDKTILDAALREAKEEAGVDIAPEDMELRLVGHQNIFLPYIDFVFVCRKWTGEPCNNEPDKCKALRWFELDALPDNIIYNVSEYLRRLPQQLQMIEL